MRAQGKIEATVSERVSRFEQDYMGLGPTGGQFAMAKYGPKSKKEVGKAMHEFKEGKLKSGKSGKKVRNPKQAIAIGLSKARKKGGKVPARKN